MNISAIVFMLVLFVLLIFFPFLAIWSLNTLFALGIGYSFKTWLSVIILTMALNGNNYVSKK